MPTITKIIHPEVRPCNRNGNYEECLCLSCYASTRDKCPHYLQKCITIFLGSGKLMPLPYSNKQCDYSKQKCSQYISYLNKNNT